MNIHGKGQNGAPQQININPEDLTFIKCECGSEVFQQGVKVGKFSSIHMNNPTGKDQLVNVPVTVCIKCGEQVEVKQ